MNIVRSLCLMITLLLIFVASINAAEKPVKSAELTQIKTAVTKVLGLRVDSVKLTPINTLFEVMTERGIFYTTADAGYIVRGSLFDTTNNFADLTELSMGKMRLSKLNNLESSMIIYPAKHEKYKITVFTDVDCGYCRKMHSHMQEYNDLGITVRYLAFPRGGDAYPAWTAMQSLWCSDDQQKAMDELKAGVRITPKSCVNKVPEHYELGVEFGVNATPSLLLNDGTLMAGYRNPQDLLELLQ